MLFLATIPMIMISPMKEAMLRLVDVTSRAITTPAIERTDELTIAMRVRKFGEQHTKDQDQRKSEFFRELGEGFLLFLVGAAILQADGVGQVKRVDSGLNALDGGAEVRAFKTAGDDNPLQLEEATGFLLHVLNFYERWLTRSFAKPVILFVCCSVLLLGIYFGYQGLGTGLLTRGTKAHSSSTPPCRPAHRSKRQTAWMQ